LNNNTPKDQLNLSLGHTLTEVRQESGFVVLGFDDGKRYQIYACGKVDFDYSADCWLGVERCDKNTLTETNHEQIIDYDDWHPADLFVC
jgi:hypothetical protein